MALECRRCGSPEIELCCCGTYYFIECDICSIKGKLSTTGQGAVLEWNKLQESTVPVKGNMHEH